MRVRYSFSSRKTGNIENIKKQRKKYPSISEEIIKQSDIIIEVLDSRLPEKTRNLETEEKIKKLNKKIIFVLNKSDLGKKNFSQKPFVFVSCKKRIGAKKLRDLIKMEAKRIEKKSERISVGVIGYPNTGKSSLINLLIGKSSAGTGNEPGFTKGIQKIKLLPGVILLDSPGVIPEKEYSSTEIGKIISHIQAGARKYSQVKNPELIIAEIMQHNGKKLEKYYDINSLGDSEILIETLGKKLNFLKKGGIVDEDKTSRKILKDIQEGGINL